MSSHKAKGKPKDYDLLSNSQLYDSQHSQTSIMLNNDDDDDDDDDEIGDSNDDARDLSIGDDDNYRPDSGGSGNSRRSSMIHLAMNPKEKVKLTNKYMKTIENIQQIQDIHDIKNGVEMLNIQLKNADKLYEFKGGANEGAELDSQCMLSTTVVTKKFINNLETDSKKFDTMEFVEKLLTLLNPAHRVNNTDDDDSDDGGGDRRVTISRNDWIEFGKRFGRLHNPVPVYEYMHGSFDAGPQMPKPVRERQLKKKKDVNAKLTQPTQVNPQTKANDESTPKEVEYMFKKICQLHDVNDKEPMNFFAAIVNPKGFGITVENFFHSTFLVKDGHVKVNEDGDDPIIEPINKDDGDDDDDEQNNENEGSQCVLSFTMDDWKKWVKKYQIRKAAFPPINKNK